MLLWRLCKVKHAVTALDGEGARLRGARWNKPGRRAVYLSEHLSLAALELLVHMSREVAPALMAIPVDVPDEVAVYRPRIADLPADWRAVGVPSSTQAFGGDWLARVSEVLMRVPSVIIPDESNYLLNPAHPDARRIKTLAPAPFFFDPRLIKG